MNLDPEPFEVMVTGEKKEEFRRPSDFIKSRLVDSKTGVDKQLKTVKFVQGYSNKRPYFTAQFKGYKFAANGVHKRYSNKLEVDWRGKPTYIIYLGDIIERGNL